MAKEERNKSAQLKLLSDILQEFKKKRKNTKKSGRAEFAEHAVRDSKLDSKLLDKKLKAIEMGRNERAAKLAKELAELETELDKLKINQRQIRKQKRLQSRQPSQTGSDVHAKEPIREAWSPRSPKGVDNLLEAEAEVRRGKTDRSTKIDPNEASGGSREVPLEGSMNPHQKKRGVTFVKELRDILEEESEEENRLRKDTDTIGRRAWRKVKHHVLVPEARKRNLKNLRKLEKEAEEKKRRECKNPDCIFHKYIAESCEKEKQAAARRLRSSPRRSNSISPATSSNLFSDFDQETATDKNGNMTSPDDLVFRSIRRPLRGSNLDSAMAYKEHSVRTTFKVMRDKVAADMPASFNLNYGVPTPNWKILNPLKIQLKIISESPLKSMRYC